jgi:alkylhydroperoxidase/carboxymuconolactone decarboxylase family protein YurZ
VLARMAKTHGQAYPPFQVLAQRPGAVSAFSAYRDLVLDQGPLSARDRALVQLTTAVALRLSFCIGKLAKNAKAAGMSQDEIVQATLIASIQSANSLLHSAHEGILPK